MKIKGIFSISPIEKILRKLEHARISAKHCLWSMSLRLAIKSHTDSFSISAHASHHVSPNLLNFISLTLQHVLFLNDENLESEFSQNFTASPLAMITGTILTKDHTESDPHNRGIEIENVREEFRK